MKLSLQFDFLVDKEQNRIIVKREFAAKRQLVWDFITTANYKPGGYPSIPIPPRPSTWSSRLAATGTTP